MADAEAVKYGVHSEVGQLRKVMVCAPGRAHQRLTPSNCDQLLFDDVLWVENARRDHFDFMQKMRDRGVDVVEMHNLLAETVAVPEAKKWILDQPGGAQPGGPRLHRRAARAISRAWQPRDLAETLIGGLSTQEVPKEIGGKALEPRARPPAPPSTCCRRCRTRSTPATPPAGSTAA